MPAFSRLHRKGNAKPLTGGHEGLQLVKILEAASTDGACLGNPGPGRLGLHSPLRGGTRERDFRIGAADHQQSDGTDGGDRGPAHAKGALRRRGGHRFRIRQERHHQVDSRLEAQRLEDRAKKPVVNQDLWMELDDLASQHKIKWTWTKGHADHEDNNRCDELATQAAREQA